MKAIKLFISLALLIVACTLNAAPKVHLVKASPKAATSFAIIVDRQTYEACKEQIDAYRAVLESEGLGTYIVSAQWDKPEDVKAQITSLKKKKPVLEGFVLIGDIPIVRIRQAQFMTTAFKMNESTFPMVESSVTSDRYYDTPDLTFRYIGKDSVNSRYFYYNLTADGPVELNPSMYSGRIMVPKSLTAGNDPYLAMRKYLQKVVEAHNESNAASGSGNPLDKMIYFAGHGYNSDCLTAWRQQPVVFREYFPSAFVRSSGNEFLNFRQNNYMKYQLFSKMQQTDTDVFLFYEHGAPDTQYINGTFVAGSTEENLRELERSLRNSYKRYKGTEDEAEFISHVSETYHLSPAIFSDEAIENERVADSLARADINISLEDLSRLKTGARITILNACYNGSFHQDEYVAGYHIFNDGRTIVAQGNTVNVLQDKWAEQLIGYLSLGLRAGLWQKEVITLESHLIGDPTFRFSKGGTNVDAEKLRILENRLAAGNRETAYWKELLKENEPVLRAAAVKQLAGTEDPAIATVIYEMFTTDPSWIVNLQALNALALLHAPQLTSAVIKGMEHPYEMIRRQSCHLAGEIGDPVFIAPLVNNVLFATEVQRVNYAAQNALGVFNPDLVRAEYLRQLDDAYLAQKEELREIVTKDLDRKATRMDKQIAVILDREASFDEIESAVRQLRNNHLHHRTDELLTVLADNTRDTKVRLLLCEALGWYTLSVERDAILNTINGCLKNEASMGSDLNQEMKKLIKRLDHSSQL